LTTLHSEFLDEEFIDTAEDILILFFIPVLVNLAHFYICEKIDQSLERIVRERRPRIPFREHSFEAGVLLLNSPHGFVDFLPDLRISGIVDEMLPSCFFWDVKDILAGVFILVSKDILAFFFVVTNEVADILRIACLLFKFSVTLLERVGHVLEEEEAESVVFVFGGIDGTTELGRSFPELLFQLAIRTPRNSHVSFCYYHVVKDFVEDDSVSSGMGFNSPVLDHYLIESFFEI
jgi:hypothetical protein